VCLVTDNLKRIKENAEEARLFEGMKIHRKDLTIDHVVASGSFGKVSMGYYEENSVAVKQLLKLTQDDIDRFKFECFLSKELRHPHIVRTVGVVWEKDCMALVSEFVANGSLGSWLNKDYERRVSGDPDVWTWKREMLKMACDIADGVMYLHNAHYYDVRSKAWQECIIHRDLKPDNFLVTDSMHVKITDFGEARALDIKGEMTVVGTPLYIAPEVMRNERYGKRVDSYSFGVVLFACLRLRPTAFEAFASSLKEDMNKSSNRGIGAAILAHRIDVGWRPRIPEEVYPTLSNLIKKCWDDDPMVRPDFEKIVDTLRGEITEEIHSLPEPDLRKTIYSDPELELEMEMKKGETNRAEA
jgi:serine/threonine protein kinase